MSCALRSRIGQRPFLQAARPTAQQSGSTAYGAHVPEVMACRVRRPSSHEKSTSFFLVSHFFVLVVQSKKFSSALPSLVYKRFGSRCLAKWAQLSQRTSGLRRLDDVRQRLSYLAHTVDVSGACSLCAVSIPYLSQECLSPETRAWRVQRGPWQKCRNKLCLESIQSTTTQGPHRQVCTFFASSSCF